MTLYKCEGYKKECVERILTTALKTFFIAADNFISLGTSEEEPDEVVAKIT